MAPGGGTLILRDAEEPAALAEPTTLTGDVDDITGGVSGASFSSAPIAFQFDITTPLHATVFVDATFSEVAPGSVTGTVTRVPGSDNLGNVALGVVVKVDLHVEVGSPPIIPAANCTASPIALRLTSTVPYDETARTVTLSDANFTVPAVPSNTSCFDTIADGINERLAGSGHSITIEMEGDLPVPESGATPSQTDLVVEPAQSKGGDEVVLAATVASDDGETPDVPTGSVEFFDGDKAIGSGSLDESGVATFATAGLGVGVHMLHALYLGDPTFSRSESSVVEHLVTAQPVAELTLPPAIVIGGLSRTMNVTIENPEQFGADVENARLDISFSRIDIQNTAVLSPSRVLVEHLDGEAWVPVTMSAAGSTKISGSVGAATGFHLPAASTTQVHLRITLPIVGLEPPVSCSALESTCPGPVIVTASLVEVDPGTGTVVEPISEVVKTIDMVESSRRVTTLSFTSAGARPHTVRQGYTVQATGNVAPVIGGLRATGQAEFFIDGEATLVRPNNAPFGNTYVEQLPLLVGNLNGFVLVPPDLGVGKHFLTVRYLGDPFFAPFDATTSFTVLPKAGEPLVCRELGSTTLMEVGANLVMPTDIPDVATNGGAVDLGLEDVQLLMNRPFAFGSSPPWVAFANNSTHVVGGPRLKDISFGFGPDGSGTAAGLQREGGTTLATSPNPATEETVDQIITLQDAAGSVTVEGEPGDVVPVALSEITLDYVLSETSPLPYKMTCTPVGGSLRLGEVEIAGTSVTAAPSPAREITDEVTIEADVFPADAAGTVAFSSDLDGDLGNQIVESGSARLATDELSPGTHEITASFEAADPEIPDTEGSTAVVITYSPRTGTQAFVVAARADFTGEAAKDDVLADAGTIDAGQSKTVYLNGLSRSDEYLAHVVDEMYLDTLGRPGDADGVEFWVGRLKAGWSVARVAASFYSSDEYYNRVGGTDEAWVGDLYGALLGRAPDTSGQAFWVGRIVVQGRGQVALAFFQTPESARARVVALYEKFLGRMPNPADRGFWAARVIARGDLILAVELTVSVEYANRARNRFPLV